MSGICFALVNQSTRDPGYGAPTAPLLQKLADSLDVWLNSDFASVWGVGGVVRYAADGSVADSEVPCYLVDDLAALGSSGTAAYHDRNSLGVPFVYVALNEYDSWLGGGSMAVSAGFGHEIAETSADAPANLWADRPDGSQEAYECADRVQGTDYVTGDNVTVPNFLLKSAFDPGAPGPYDFRKVLAGQLDMTPQGYAIVRQQGTAYSQEHPSAEETVIRLKRGTFVSILGNWTGMSAATLARKRHPISRTYKRGVR
jgi:hypothetical protein